MGYVAPTWQNGGPPALNAEKLQDISNNLAYVSNNLVNPNLLDNGYFGNPVDQMKGYVVPPGIEYKDTSSGTTVGVTAAYYPVLQFIDQNAIINIAGTNYFVRPGDYVRGYTGAGYTIDRWKLDIGDGVTIDNGLNIIKANLYLGQYFDDFDKYIGRQLVGSVLMGDGNLYTGTFVYNGVLNQGQTFFANARVGMYVQKVSDTLTQVEINTSADNQKVLAVKLELGSQQTLAHQENGVWVLNEIPKFGDQLAECQRYALELNPLLIDYFTAALGVGWDNAGEVDFAIPVPVTMRANPVAVNAANWKVVDTTDGSFHAINAMELYSGSGAIKVVCHIDSSVRGRTYALMCDNVNKSLFVSANL